MKHSEWVDTLTDGATTRAIGEKLGIAHTTIARQIKAEKLSPEMVIDLCRAFGKLPVDGLLETGYLEYGDIEGAGIPQALRWATNRQLLGEINRRSEPEATRLFGKSSGLINPVVSTNAQVFEFPSSPTVEPISDEELEEAVRDANARPRAAHPADDIEYTEPEFP